MDVNQHKKKQLLRKGASETPEPVVGGSSPQKSLSQSQIPGAEVASADGKDTAAGNHAQQEQRTLITTTMKPIAEMMTLAKFGVILEKMLEFTKSHLRTVTGHHKRTTRLLKQFSKVDN